MQSLDRGSFWCCVRWTVAITFMAVSGLASAQADRDALERLEQARTAKQQRDAAAMAPMAGGAAGTGR